MKDPLFGNKLAAAVLTVALLFFGLPILVDTFLGGGHHGDKHHEGEVDAANPLQLAYPIPLSFEGAPVVEEVVLDLGTLLAAASVTRGERAAGACLSCHTFEQGGNHGTGPNLWNIVGNTVGHVEDFNFSQPLLDAGGTWTYERLDAYLENSQAYIPGGAMVQRIRKAERRADLLAYLQTLSPDPVPFPEPAPPAVEEDVAEAGEAIGDMIEGAVDAAAGEVAEVVQDAADAVEGAVEEVVNE